MSIISIERCWFRDRDERRVLSGVVYKTKRRGPKNFGEHHKSRHERLRKTVFTFDMKTAIRQVRLKPFQDRPVKTKPRRETSN